MNRQTSERKDLFYTNDREWKYRVPLRKNKYNQKWFVSDEQFNQLYPQHIQVLARRHWTSLTVVRKAAEFLSAENNKRILDIGSGPGKFCLAAAFYQPGSFFYGVEQRKNLVGHAETAKNILQLDNASFFHLNFTQLDFRGYDHFYFYNSFFENLSDIEKIDDTIDYSAELFNYYNRYLYKQLEQKPPGTRLATFHSPEDEVPKDFLIVGSAMDNLLKFWIKV